MNTVGLTDRDLIPYDDSEPLWCDCDCSTCRKPLEAECPPTREEEG